MPALSHIYLSCIAIAFISSLISFRLDFSFPLRFFSVLLGLTLVVELVSSGVVGHFHKKNYWIYNFWTLLEFWAYGYFYYRIMLGLVRRRITLIYLWLFPVFWLFTNLYVYGFNQWNSYVIIAGSFFSIVFVAMYYHQLVTAVEFLPLRGLTEFWIATGMLIFYSGALPYFGALNYLVKQNVEVARILLYVLRVLDALMYLLFSYGYLCRYRILNSRKS